MYYNVINMCHMVLMLSMSPLIFLYPGRLTHLTCQQKTWLSGKNEAKVDIRLEPPEIEMS